MCSNKRTLIKTVCLSLASAEKNWNMRLVGVADNLADLKVIRKSGMTDGHKVRLADVRKSKLNHR